MKKAVRLPPPYLERRRTRWRSGRVGGKEAEARSSSPPSRATCTTSATTIVGVVRACNGYEIIDSVVMVPADKILAAAREHQVDFVASRADHPVRSRR